MSHGMFPEWLLWIFYFWPLLLGIAIGVIGQIIWYVVLK